MKKRMFRIITPGKDVFYVSARGKTAACHKFCGYRPVNAISLGLIKSISEL